MNKNKMGLHGLKERCVLLFALFFVDYGFHYAYADVYVYIESDGTQWLTNHRLHDSKYKLLKVYNEPGQKVNRSPKSKSTKTNHKLACSGTKQSTLDKRAAPYQHFIRTWSRAYSVEENLVRAIIRTESCFKVRAKSPVGAQGLMQLMPGTAGDMGVNNAYDPDDNIQGGTRYISYLLGLYDGDKRLALAAYNAGPGKVKKYKGIPPYKETRNYVKKVMAEYHRLEKLAPSTSYSQHTIESSDEHHIFTTYGNSTSGQATMSWSNE